MTPRARLPRWLLERCLPADLRDAILGDLEETRASASTYWRELLRAPRTWFVARPAVAAPIHETPGDPVVTTLLADLRFAWRALMRRKGMTALAAGTLALAIGASTAIYSAVHPILVRTLPYPGADRVTMLWERDGQGGRINIGFTTFDDLAQRTRSFESMAAAGYWSATMTTAGEPRPFLGQRVSPDYFRVLGVRPMLGRDFTREDDLRGAPNVVMVSHAAWRDAFASDPAIVGRSIVLDGDPYTIIGVMPAGFENLLSPPAQAWRPLRYERTLPWACRSCKHLRVVARLREGVDPAAARSEVDALAQEMMREFPKEYVGAGLITEPMARWVTAPVRPALLALSGAVLLVLLVAALNVSNLLLARGAGRRGEFAVRMALGAPRGRIIRQLLTESLVLAAIGGAAGIALAWAGVQALVALSPPDLPRLGAIQVDGAVLLFALGVTTVVGMLFGLMPAWQASGATIHEGVRSGARTLVGSDRVTRATVVVSEVALASVLLVGAGLLVRSMDRLLAISPGFDPAGVLTVQVQAGAGGLRSDTLVHRFYDVALATVRTLPGVESAAFTSQLPLSGDFDGYGVRIQSRAAEDPAGATDAFRYAVSDGYFETMRIPLVQGRLFTAADGARGAPVAIVSAGFAQRFLGGLDPLRERVRVGGGEPVVWRQIVGVVGDVRQVSLEEGDVNAVYLPESQWIFADYQRSLVVRTQGDPAALTASVRDAIWSVDKDQPLVRVATAESLVARTAAARRFALVLFELFALVALLLAATGIYGVLIGSVTERMREMGVRSAFGASARDLIWMVVRQGMRLTLAGVVAGIALALAATRLMTTMLFGVSAVDPVTYLSVTAGLLVVALVACAWPAYRASRVDPMEALRAE